jgi:hypothetical protein
MKQSMQLTLAVALVSGAIAGTAFSQGYPSTPSTPATPAQPSSTMTPPSTPSTPPATSMDKTTSPSATGMTPSKSEMASSAFTKLDASKRGYVTKADVAQLQGFDAAFQQADTNNDGKLSKDEFDRAWAIYSGQKQ